MKLGEKGFTLIELLMVIAIVALIANAAAMSTFQVLRNTEGNRNKMTAVNQVQNAGYWISLDAQRAQTVEAASANATAATVSWDQSEYGTLEPDDVLYFALSGDGGSSWGSNIEAFRDDDPPPTSPFNYIIPQQYLTADFKMRFLVDFSSSDESAYVDNIDISPGIFTDDCSSFANWDNGAKWNVVSGEFKGDGGGEAGWYDENWQYRKEITIDPAKVEAGLLDFPVLISLPSDYDLANDAQDDGDDILFTNAGGTFKLSHEIEYFDDGNGELVAWVKVSSLSSSTDTILYMYYGNASATNQQDAAGVWDSNFKLVTHMRDDPDNLHTKDSTVNNNDGTKIGAGQPAVTTSGQIDDAQDFGGGNYEIDHQNSSSLQITDSLTIEAWSKPDVTGTYMGIAGKLVEAGGYAGYALVKHDTNYFRFMIASAGSTDFVSSDSAYADTDWHYVVGRRSGGTNYLYVDGVLQTDTSTQTLSDSGDDFRIGRQYKDYDGRWWDGIIDEVRVSNIDRSAEWIKTSYNNQSSPSGFYSLGTEETEGSSSPSEGYLTMSTSLDLSSYAVAEGFPLTFEWTTWDESGGIGHQVTYNLADGKLIRSWSIDDDDPIETYIAQYIDPANTSCSFTIGKLTFTVAATVGSGSAEISESRQFRVLTRPD